MKRILSFSFLVVLFIGCSNKDEQQLPVILDNFILINNKQIYVDGYFSIGKLKRGISIDTLTTESYDAQKVIDTSLANTVMLKLYSKNISNKIYISSEAMPKLSVYARINGEDYSTNLTDKNSIDIQVLAHFVSGTYKATVYHYPDTTGIPISGEFFATIF